MRIGEKLRLLRMAKGISQKDVAESANISPQYYSEIEGDKEKIRCPIDTLGSICKALGTNLSDFFKDDLAYIEIPEELRDIGVEFIQIAKEIENKKLSKDDIDNLKNVIKLLKNQDGNQD